MPELKDKKSTANLMQQALAQHQAGDIEAAQSSYEQHLEQHPNDVHTLQLLAILKGQLAAYPECQALLEKALCIAPNSAQLHNNLANALKHQGKKQAAIAAYQQAIRLDKTSAAAHHNLAVLYQQQNQPDLACQHYQASLKIKPDYQKARYHLALLHIQQVQIAQAKSHLQTLIEQTPENPLAHYHLGQLYHQDNQLDTAVSHYNATLKADPNHPLAHHNLAAALVNQGHWEKAIAHFHRTIELDPEHDSAHENLAATYLAQNQHTKALEHYLQQLDIAPSLESYYNIGVLYMHQDKHQDAITYLKEALKINVNHLETHINLGAVYLKIADYPAAQQHYEAAKNLDPDNAELDYILSAINDNKAQFTQAPDSYITHLFDQYAPHFDQHLTEYLQYQTPAQLQLALTEHLGSLSSLSWDICDLGCGSGLSGVPFKPMAKSLTGIDLSSKMLAMAQEKNIYDHLIQANITQAEHILSSYHLVICADTLPYIGDLATIFKQVAQLLKPEGYFTFTIEKTHKHPYILQRSARFAHHQDYIKYIAKQHDFIVETENNVVIRQDRGKAVEGYLYLLRSSKHSI